MTCWSSIYNICSWSSLFWYQQ